MVEVGVMGVPCSRAPMGHLECEPSSGGKESGLTSDSGSQQGLHRRPIASVEPIGAQATFTASGALSRTLSRNIQRRFLLVDDEPSIKWRAGRIAQLNGINASWLAFHTGVVQGGFYKYHPHIIGLTRLLRLHRLPCRIDWFLVDVRGVQRDFFRGGTVMPLLTKHVKRMLIILPLVGAEVGVAILKDMFKAHAWRLSWTKPAEDPHGDEGRWGGAFEHSRQLIAMVNPSLSSGGVNDETCPWQNPYARRRRAPPDLHLAPDLAVSTHES